jgi:glycosyltransferase involved in cell wall biosynthesis
VDIHHICKAEKVHVVPLGFDLSKFQENTAEKRSNFRKKYNLDDDEIAISIIGRLVPVKNHALFLDALKIVAAKTSRKVRAFIIGDGESRMEVEAKARELNIPFVDGTQTNEKQLLTFTSWIKDIDTALAGSDIIALTSFNEGTPVSLIEAQAANKPIVTTNVGGIENVVLPGQTAFLCENNNSGQVAEALLKLIENEQLRASMAEKGWLHVKEKFQFYWRGFRNIY